MREQNCLIIFVSHPILVDLIPNRTGKEAVVVSTSRGPTKSIRSLRCRRTVTSLIDMAYRVLSLFIGSDHEENLEGVFVNSTNSFHVVYVEDNNFWQLVGSVLHKTKDIAKSQYVIVDNCSGVHVCRL